MNKLFAPLAVWLAVLAMPPAAGAQTPITLEAAIARTLGANPALRAAASEAAAQEGALSQAGALPNPELSLLREGQGRDTRTSTASLSIPIELGGKRAARIDSAQQQRQLALIEADALRVQLRFDTVAAFYDVHAALERLRMANEMTALAGRALYAATRRVELGKASPVDATRARVAEANARIDALHAARDLQAAQVRLAALWGGDATGLEIVAPAAPVLPDAPPLAPLLARLDQAPGMRRARAQITQNAALVRIEQARRTPDVNVIVGVRREGPEQRNQAVLGVSVPLPLFDRNNGAVLAALRRVERARDEQDAEGVRLRTALSEAHGRLTSARSEAALIEAEILPGAQGAAQAAQRGFEAGKFGILDVLDAQRTLVQSHTQYQAAVAACHRAAADIARLSGMALDQENP